MFDSLLKKFKRNIASAIALCGVILVICIFFIPIIVIGGYEIKDLAISFPQYSETIKEYILSLPFVSKTALTQIDIGGVLSSASGVTTKIIYESINIGKHLGSTIVYLIISTIIIYYFTNMLIFYF